MSALAGVARFGGLHSLRRFSVADYHRMIQAGVLTDEDRVELLDGYVVLKMPRNPPHDGTIDLIKDILPALLPAGWMMRVQQAVTLSASEPEPDVALVRGAKRTYLSRHPGAADVGLIVEVADSSLDRDRNEKASIYAQEGIPAYWVVNLVDRLVEVRTSPSVVSGQPWYAQRQDFAPGEFVPLTLAGVSIASIDARDLLP